eukprot:2451212-Ditylum_brightwellii.AAC.1
MPAAAEPAAEVLAAELHGAAGVPAAPDSSAAGAPANAKLGAVAALEVCLLALGFGFSGIMLGICPAQAGGFA